MWALNLVANALSSSRVSSARAIISVWTKLVGSRGPLTLAVMFVVGLAVDQRRHLLEVPLGLIQHQLQGAQLFLLVGPPLAFIGEAQDSQRVGQRGGNGRKQRPDRVGAAHRDRRRYRERLVVQAGRKLGWARKMISRQQRSPSSTGGRHEEEQPGLPRAWGKNAEAVRGSWMDPPTT